MATTQDDIRRWFEEAKRRGATHIVVACDTFSNEDYPVYVMPGEDVKKVEEEYQSKKMSKVMEVYSMKLDLESQLQETRAFHYD